jgi:hypothetical protein
MAAATTASRTRSLVKYGTRSSGMAGSPDSMAMRPPRTFLKPWLRAPRDISTARITAWSPPTRACETLRGASAAPAPAPGAVGAPARTGPRYLAALPFFFPLRLTRSSLRVPRGVMSGHAQTPSPHPRKRKYLINARPHSSLPRIAGKVARSADASMFVKGLVRRVVKLSPPSRGRGGGRCGA